MRSQLPNVLLAVALSAGALACSSDPDILASEKATSPYLDAQVLQDCRAGLYVGIFTTAIASDSGPPFQVSGTMSFQLVAKGREFLELEDNAHLSGTSNSPLPNATVSATLQSETPCHDGQITTKFENGVYMDKTVSIPFQGGSAGNYSNDTDGFVGFWKATVVLGGPPIDLYGTWYAFRQ